MVMLCLLVRVTSLPVDLELVIGPFGAVGVGAPGGFADDESRPPAREASPPSASAVHHLALCLPLSVVMLGERKEE